MMTLEKRHDLIKVLEPYFLPKRLHSTKSYFIKARKACKSLEKLVFTSFYRVLPTSRVGYHAGKPIESVVYCSIILHGGKPQVHR